MQGTRRRWSALFAVLCVALGTAAVAMVLDLLDATLWRALPYPQAEQLVRVWIHEPAGDPRIDVSIPEFLDLERDLGGVEAIAGAARSRMVARLPGGPERLRGEAVDPDYFDLLGIRPARGRLFDASDHAPGSPDVALVSDAVWRDRFGHAEDILDRTLPTADRNLRIVGVLPPGFEGSIEDDVVEYWLPLSHYAPAMLAQDRTTRQTWTLARLAPGETLATLGARLDALGADWRTRHPEAYTGLAVRAEPFGENWREPLRRNASLQLAAVVALLAIAIANVAALLFARAIDRRSELALRSAIGASRGRVLALLLRETFVIAFAGGVLGALAAPWLLQGLLAIAPLKIPAYIATGFHWRSGLLAAGTLTLAALAAAAVPAWLGSRVAPAEALAGDARGSTGRRDRRGWNALVGAEIALSFVLLVGGALLVRSYLALANVGLGYRTENVLRLAVSLSPIDTEAGARLVPLQARIAEHLRAQPGVLGVGLVSPTLPPWDAYRPALRHDALGLQPDEPGLAVGGHAIDPGLLATLGIALQSGRAIEPGDGADAPPVALVSAALAERLGGADAVLGSLIDLGDEATRPSGVRRVVGVVGDTSWDGLGEQDTGRYIRYDGGDARGSRFDVYVPLAQSPNPVVSIGVHTGPEPVSLIEPLKRALAEVAPNSAVHWVSTMEEQLADEYAASRFYLVLVLVFGLTALLLSAVGLFALLTHAVLARGREIGIRLALGADASRIARLVLGSGARLVGTGLLAGAALAFAGMRLLDQVLYGVSAFDPLAYAVAAATLGGCGMLACLWPLRRAVALPATEVLRAS